MKYHPAILLLAALSALAPLSCSSPPPSPKVVPSLQTTLITAPLHPDGTPDYLSYINSQLSKNVTPQNNAAIPLLRTLGPSTFFYQQDNLAPIYAQLHMAPLSKEGPYFIQLYDFRKQFPQATSSGPRPDKDPEAEMEVGVLAVGVRESPWVAAQYPLTAAWLTANEKQLAQIESASRLPYFYIPLVAPTSPPSLADAFFRVSLDSLRQASDPFIARAQLRIASNDPAGALEDTFTVRRLAHLANQRPFLTSHIRAAAVDQEASLAQQRLVRSGKLSQAQLSELLTHLQRSSLITLFHPTLPHEELFFTLDLVLPIARGRPDETFNFILDPHKQLTPQLKFPQDFLLNLDTRAFLEALVSYQHEIDQALAQPHISETVKSLERLQDKREDAGTLPLPRLALTRNDPAYAGKTDEERIQLYKEQLIQFFTRGDSENPNQFAARAALYFTSDTAFFLLCDAIRIQTAQTHHHLALLTAALALHHAQHNSYPESLDALVTSHILKSLPLDPFTQKPFLYKKQPTSYLLYSAGPNARDNSAVPDDISTTQPAPHAQ